MTRGVWTRSSRIAGALIGLAISACTPLRIFNAVIPQDRGVRVVARDMAFGPYARQRVDLYAPSARTGAPLPVIVFIYGGSWSSGSKDGYAFVGRALAAQGFLVAIPDYRLVPKVQYPAFVEDDAAAVRWVRAHVRDYDGDPDRIVLMGHSAGAYGAAMLALDPRWLGPDRDAVRGLIGLAGPYDFLPFDGPIVKAAFEGVDDPKSTQPVVYASAGDPPAFLATGDKDNVVKPSNSDALTARLTAAGVAAERRRYPELGHAGLVTSIAKPFRGKAPVLADLVAFARRVTAQPNR